MAATLIATGWDAVLYLATTFDVSYSSVAGDAFAIPNAFDFNADFFVDFALGNVPLAAIATESFFTFGTSSDALSVYATASDAI